MPTPTGPVNALANGTGGYQVGDGYIGEPILGRQDAHVALAAAATVTPANLINGVIAMTNAGATALTLPLATDLDAAIPNAGVNSCFDFSVLSLGGGTCTVTTNTGWTLVGLMAVTTALGAFKFRARKTAAGAWTLYLLG